MLCALNKSYIYTALGAALAFYNAVKLAAANNVPGAQAIYDDLSALFPGRAKKAASAAAAVVK